MSAASYDLPTSILRTDVVKAKGVPKLICHTAPEWPWPDEKFVDKLRHLWARRLDIELECITAPMSGASRHVVLLVSFASDTPDRKLVCLKKRANDAIDELDGVPVERHPRPHRGRHERITALPKAA